MWHAESEQLDEPGLNVALHYVHACILCCILMEYVGIYVPCYVKPLLLDNN